MLFWGWVYRLRPAHDELRFAVTNDGWRIAVARRAPRGDPRSPPVLLCHGLSVNRFSLDFGVPRYSLALSLAESGFDCFALDLRGHGDSRRGRSRSWTFDTYLSQDIPAALDEIRSVTGIPEVLWVGHSQGALLGLVAASTVAARIAGVVAIAPPTHFHAHDRLRKLLPFAFLATGQGHRYLARAATPIAGWFHPALAQFAWNSRNIDARIYRQVLANVVEDVPRRVLDQFLDWMRRDPRTFQLVTPAFLGRERYELVLGKMSSRESLAVGLAERGFTFNPLALDRVFEGLKELSGRQRTITEADILRLAQGASMPIAAISSIGS